MDQSSDVIPSARDAANDFAKQDPEAAAVIRAKGADEEAKRIRIELTEVGQYDLIARLFPHDRATSAKSHSDLTQRSSDAQVADVILNAGKSR